MDDHRQRHLITALARHLAARRPAMVELLAQLVNRDSPSDHKGLLDGMASFLEAELGRRGGQVQRLRQAGAGDHLVARFFPGGDAQRAVLLLAHYDTVWPPGEAARRPFRQEGGRGYGPGSLDMKAGIVIGLEALSALAALVAGEDAGWGPGEGGVRDPAGGPPALEPAPLMDPAATGTGARPRPLAILPPVTFLLTSDEETGSRTSRALIEDLARRHQAVLVLEPAAGGRLKTARKGVGDFRLVVEGREAHAGNDPGRGISAVEELARQILRLHALSDPGRGTTVNVGVVRGGLRPNVVAGRAEAEVDIRVATLEEARRVEDLFERWGPVNPEARVILQGGFDRPPMEFTPANQALFHRAQRVGSWLGMTVEGAAVGGASDGNFTSALGIPTLDGLGATGDGAHALDEHVDLDELPRRAALVAGLILDLGAVPFGPDAEPASAGDRG